MMKDHAGESESDTEMRQERAIAALVAAVSAGDEMFEATMTRGGRRRTTERALVERDIETVEAKRAVRALVALANANQTIRDRVARLFCDTFRELGATAAPGGRTRSRSVRRRRRRVDAIRHERRRATRVRRSRRIPLHERRRRTL